MIILGIYITGVWLAFILLLLLSMYYTNYAETKGIRLEQTMLPCLLSWVIVILVLFVYAKLFESIVTVEGEDFFNAREEKECYKLVKELIKFVYEELGKLSNYNSKTANEELNKHMKKMFKNMRKSLQEEIGSIDKGFLKDGK